MHAWDRLVETWHRFVAKSRDVWWAYLIVSVVVFVFQARLETFADTLVAQLEAAGVVADIVRGLIGPLGALALLIGVLLVIAYLETRRSHLGEGQARVFSGTEPTKPREGDIWISDSGSDSPEDMAALRQRLQEESLTREQAERRVTELERPLAHTSGQPAERGSPLDPRQRIYESVVVPIALLLEAGPIIADRELIECVVEGPGVLYLTDGSTLLHPRFADTSRKDDLFAQAASPGSFRGAIRVERTTFQGCTFRNIGLIGTAENVKAWKKNMSGV